MENSFKMISHCLTYLGNLMLSAQMDSSFFFFVFFLIKFMALFLQTRYVPV